MNQEDSQGCTIKHGAMITRGIYGQHRDEERFVFVQEELDMRNPRLGSHAKPKLAEENLQITGARQLVWPYL